VTGTPDKGFNPLSLCDASRGVGLHGSVIANSTTLAGGCREMPRMRRPNLFIIGSPKAGTTALAAWLATHPRIYFSPRKEPIYFSTDFFNKDRPTEDQYLELFSNSNSSHVYLAEGSTRYLASKVAIPKIEKWATDPRYIAIVRNPVELLPSLHNHHIFLGCENKKDFEDAWKHSDARTQGLDIPRLCDDPDSLVYTRMGKLGEQVDRLFSMVPEQRRLVLLYDDLRRDPREFYLRVLDFLALEDDGRTDFTPENISMGRRSDFLGTTINLLAEAKRKMKVSHSFNVLQPLLAFNRVDRRRQPLSTELKREMQAYFESDINLLSRLLQRDLSHWAPSLD
jgi:hypothetical protein